MVLCRRRLKYRTVKEEQGLDANPSPAKFPLRVIETYRSDRSEPRFLGPHQHAIAGLLLRNLNLPAWVYI